MKKMLKILLGILVVLVLAFVVLNLFLGKIVLNHPVAAQ